MGALRGIQKKLLEIEDRYLSKPKAPPPPDFSGAFLAQSVTQSMRNATFKFLIDQKEEENGKAIGTGNA